MKQRAHTFQSQKGKPRPSPDGADLNKNLQKKKRSNFETLTQHQNIHSTDQCKCWREKQNAGRTLTTNKKSHLHIPGDNTAPAADETAAECSSAAAPHPITILALLLPVFTSGHIVAAVVVAAWRLACCDLLPREEREYETRGGLRRNEAPDPECCCSCTARRARHLREGILIEQKRRVSIRIPDQNARFRDKMKATKLVHRKPAAAWSQDCVARERGEAIKHASTRRGNAHPDGKNNRCCLFHRYNFLIVIINSEGDRPIFPAIVRGESFNKCK